MNCGRCQGLCVRERFSDLDDPQHKVAIGWRCLVCGDIKFPGFKPQVEPDIKRSTAQVLRKYGKTFKRGPYNHKVKRGAEE